MKMHSKIHCQNYLEGLQFWKRMQYFSHYARLEMRLTMTTKKTPNQIKPYILVSDKEFSINCDGYTLLAALKLIFREVKSKKPKEHKIICKHLIETGVFDNG